MGTGETGHLQIRLGQVPGAMEPVTCQDWFLLNHLWLPIF